MLWSVAKADSTLFVEMDQGWCVSPSPVKFWLYRMLVFRPTVVRDALELLRRGDGNKDVSVDLGQARTSRRSKVQVGGSLLCLGRLLVHALVYNR